MQIVITRFLDTITIFIKTTTNNNKKKKNYYNSQLRNKYKYINGKRKPTKIHLN